MIALFLVLAAAPPKDDINIDPALRERPKPVMMAWMTYAATTAVGYQATKDQSRGPQDFMPEVVGRAFLANKWKEMRSKEGAPADEYLDNLVRVGDADYVSELVLAYLSEPGWTIPKTAIEKLQLAKFLGWVKASWPTGAKAVTLASYRYVDDETRRVPGANLDDLSSQQKIDCDAHARHLQQQIDVWAKERATLKKRPFSVSTRDELVTLVNDLQKTGADDVIWVSPKVARIFYIAGFCAIEHKEHELGAKLMREVLALHPRDQRARLELAHALTMAKQYDASLKELEIVLKQEPDRCRRSKAWRSKGFTLIELKKYADAKAALNESLKLDPANKYTLHELTVVEQAMGGKASDAKATSETAISTCLD